MKLLLLLCLYHVTWARNPGAQVRLSQQGINYAGGVLVDKLASKVSGQRIPDQSGEAHTAVGKVHYEFKNMQVTGFTKPSFSASLIPPNKVQLSLSGAGLSIHGDWSYKIRILFPVRDSGSIDVSLSGVTLSATMALGEQGGRPTVAPAGCSCDIAGVHVDIHTGLDWLYNLFKGTIEDAIKNTLKNKLCDIVNDEIQNDAASALAKLKIQVPMVDDIATLHYGLTAPPQLASGYIDFLLNGEVLLPGDQPGASGINPAPFPDAGDAGHMLQFFLSDFVLDTLGYSLQKYGFLSYNLTKDDLQATDQHYLNITCDDSSIETKCVGSFIPQLRKHEEYKNGSVLVGMWSTVQPRLEIRPDTLAGMFRGNLAFFVQTANSAQPQYVFTANVSEQFILKAALSKNKLTAQIVRSKVVVDIQDSKIGNIPDTGLQWLFNFINTVFIKDQLNKKGAEGFDLPKIDNVDFVDPQFVLVKDALVLKTNLHYQP